MSFRPVAHAAPQPDPTLLATHALAGVGSGLLLALGVAAFAQRGSRSYLLVVLALAALLGRTAVSAMAMFGPLAPALHHVAEHGLDAMVVTFLLLAVYFARSGDPLDGSAATDADSPARDPPDGDASPPTPGERDAREEGS